MTLLKIVIGLASVTFTAIGASVRALMKHGAQQQTIDESKAKIAELEEQRELHATRIALLEKAVLAMEKIEPAVQEMSRISARLETLLDVNSRRLDYIERFGCAVAHRVHNQGALRSGDDNRPV